MDTTRILAFRHPSQLAMLMDSLVATAVRLPATAAKITDRGGLPAVLQRMAIRAAKARMEWRAWLQGDAIILLTAEHIAPPATHPKAPTLRLSICGARGGVKDRSDWIYLPSGKWQRLRKLG
jgi:hypothetical protein